MILQVHEIDVKPIGIDPDPKVVRQNDVVAWNFEDLVESDVREVKTDADVKAAESTPVPIIPRLVGLNKYKCPALHFIHVIFISGDQQQFDFICILSLDLCGIGKLMC